MRYLTDSKTMKEVDTRAQEEIGIPGSVLMERAALAVAETVQAKLDKLSAIHL